MCAQLHQPLRNVSDGVAQLWNSLHSIFIHRHQQLFFLVRPRMVFMPHQTRLKIIEQPMPINMAFVFHVNAPSRYYLDLQEDSLQVRQHIRTSKPRIPHPLPGFWYRISMSCIEDCGSRRAVASLFMLHPAYMFEKPGVSILCYSCYKPEFTAMICYMTLQKKMCIIHTFKSSQWEYLQGIEVICLRVHVGNIIAGGHYTLNDFSWLSTLNFQVSVLEP